MQPQTWKYSSEHDDDETNGRCGLAGLDPGLNWDQRKPPTPYTATQKETAASAHKKNHDLSPCTTAGGIALHDQGALVDRTCVGLLAPAIRRLILGENCPS